MALTIITATLFFLIFLLSKLPSSTAQEQPWIQAGYWFSGSGFPISDINSALFTHLICAFAGLNSSTYELSISSSDSQLFSNFTNTVKQKNPSIKTLLSIGGGLANRSHYSSMVSQSSYRKSFIDSSIKTARAYGFHGIDFSWVSVGTDSEIANMAILFDEWRVAIESESRNSNGSIQLVLTMAAQYSPYVGNGTFPIGSINKNLNWVHVMAFDYYMPKSWNQTGAQAALYDPGSEKSTDFGINSWINKGLSANKLVLGLPFHGYAWTLVNPKDSAIGAPAKGPAINIYGAMSYKDIKGYIQTYRGVLQYNATYVVNYCTIGSSWIGFDDVEVVKIKVAYAKKKNLLGYFVWQIPQDDNWVLSQAAQEDKKTTINNKGRLLLVILLTATAIIILILSSTMWYLRKRVLRCIGLADEQKESESKLRTTMASIENTNVPQVFSFTDIVVATNNFSNENKLGEGGYGPVYKVI
ncbi:Class V chitinase [Camellia lanceoleosa]|uniref:Class V chitinase n=1 Tax=Camellia lanceoleosa TaxID=1840588 RepID=A0ACC0HYW6_9ERIC|nr:Class V chitinase [Camellia lanceoleosa]